MVGLKKRPPKKCLPLNHLTSGFGAVKLIRAGGMNPFPGPSSLGPSSMSQEDGASTARTGILVDAKASMTFGKGSRTSPEKEKPKMASTMWSVCCRAPVKSSVNGTLRSSSCFFRRCRTLVNAYYQTKESACLVELVLALLWVVYGRLIPVVVKVARSNETISSIVARPTSDQYSLAFVERLKLEHGLRNTKSSQFHQLINRECAGRHELLIERRCAFGRNCLASK